MRGYVGVVDTDGIMFIYKDSEELREQVKKGTIKEEFLLTKKADECFEIPEKGFNIFKVSIKV